MVLKRILDWLFGWKRIERVDTETYKVHCMQLLFKSMEQIRAYPLLLDGVYYVPTLETWKQIIESDLLRRKKKYVQDRFDCDNFAIVFAAHCMEYYDINSCGIAIGDVVYDDEERTRLPHAWNVLPTIENEELVLYVYEPQTGELKRGEPRTRLKMGWYITDYVVYG